MSKPTWIPGITANIIKRVMEHTPGQIIDWSDEIEKGVNAAVEEAQARIAELESQLADSEHIRQEAAKLYETHYDRMMNGQRRVAALEAALGRCRRIAYALPDGDDYDLLLAIRREVDAALAPEDAASDYDTEEPCSKCGRQFKALNGFMNHDCNDPDLDEPGLRLERAAEKLASDIAQSAIAPDGRHSAETKDAE